VEIAFAYIDIYALSYAQLYDGMRKRVAVIQIKPTVGDTFEQTGITVDCESHFAYVITDPRELMNEIGISQITVVFPDNQKLCPPPEHFLVRNGVVGILCCGSFDADLVKKIEIHNQAPMMSQEVRVYEAVFKNITEGNIT
jgi:hypothetical protein